MKYNIYKLRFLLPVFAIFLFSCENDILDKKPLDSYSDPTVWADISLAEYYLNSIYNNVEYGWNQRSHGYQTGLFVAETVLTKGADLTEYSTSSISSGNLGTDRGHLTWHHFSNIYKLNYFLENVDQLVDAASESEKESTRQKVEVLKGEAIFLRAVFYTDICRSYGGVPIIKEASNLGDDFSQISRASFEETVNFIVEDCTKAAELLPLKSQAVMGRANKEVALGLKSRILVFAASDLTADGTAENKYVGYENPNRTALWTAARDAAKELIDLGTVALEDFGTDLDDISRGYYDIFSAHDLSSEEVLWGKMHRNDVGSAIHTNRRLGPNGNFCHGNNSPYGNFVDAYQMIDGTDFFDHFEVNNKVYQNVSQKFTNPNPYKNRDPRFYASVLYDSAVWQPRFQDLADLDPLGIYDRRTRIVIENGQVVSERFGLDSRQGPITPFNGSYTGYLMKKFTDDAIIGRDEANVNIFVWMRYAEVLLNYAEASLELGDIETAKEYINKVRNRSGMPDVTGDVEATLRYERKIEFFSENVGWYDVRRWKGLEENFDQDLYGVDIVEVIEDGVSTTTWSQVQAAPRKTFSKKLYWIPISDDELNRAPQLVQNPGY